MGKKRHNAKGKKQVLSLAEFNEDHAITSPDGPALPTAPKAPEEWEREGGRPEYNQRGYKERQPRPDRSSAYDEDFEDRDWTRKGPLDDDSQGFGNGPERDWGDMRRGPLDAPEDAAPRDWDGMRRGPVDSTFEGRGESTMDWSSRKGPVDAASSATAPVGDGDWGTARKGPVEAEFVKSENRDWTMRSPVESTAQENEQQEADWTAPRKGPVDSQFEQSAEGERDWNARKGPFDADITTDKQDVNWSGMRSGTGIDAEVPKAQEESDNVTKSEESNKDTPIDWSARRGPMKARDESVRQNPREIDFSEVRRGARVQQPTVNTNEQSESTGKDVEDAGRWRRARGSARPVSAGFDNPSQSIPRERNWRSARTRSQPSAASAADSATKNEDNGEEGDNAISAATDGVKQDAENDDWTTVRSGAHRRDTRGGSTFSRRGGRGFGRGGSAGGRRTDGLARSGFGSGTGRPEGSRPAAAAVPSLSTAEQES